ncbi:MAG: site-specific DNA-methyltransferase [Anaerolineae bacterium]
MELDRIYCASSNAMRDVDDNSVQLIVTSPPYNVGKDYNYYADHRPLDEYLDMLMGVWKECQRVLVPGGRIAVNVANTNRNPYLPLHAFIIRQFLDLKFLMRGEILWDKSVSAGVSTAWGSFGRSSNPVLRDTHEYIMVFSKETMRLDKPYTHGDYSGIENMEFVAWTKSIWHGDDTAQASVREIENSIWHFATQSKKIKHLYKEIEHPAPFPLDLPLRLTLLYTNVDDIVLDPFMGTGSTAIAAKLTQRHYLGYDISPDYIEIAEARIQLYTQQPFIPEFAPRQLKPPEKKSKTVPFRARVSSNGNSRRAKKDG